MEVFGKKLANSILAVFADQTGGLTWSLASGGNARVSYLKDFAAGSGVKATVSLISKEGVPNQPIEVAVLQILHTRRKSEEDEFRDLVLEFYDAEQNLRQKCEFVQRFFLCAAVTSSYANFHLSRSCCDMIQVRKKFFLDVKVDPLAAISLHKSPSLFRSKSATFSQKLENSREKLNVSLTLFDNLKPLNEMLLRNQVMEARNEGRRTRIFSEDTSDFCVENPLMRQSMERRPSKVARPFQLVNEVMFIDNLKENMISEDEADPAKNDASNFEMQIKADGLREVGLLTNTSVAFKTKKNSDKQLEIVDLELPSHPIPEEVEQLYSIVKNLKKSFVAAAKKKKAEAPARRRMLVSFEIPRN